MKVDLLKQPSVPLTSPYTFSVLLHCPWVYLPFPPDLLPELEQPSLLKSHAPLRPRPHWVVFQPLLASLSPGSAHGPSARSTCPDPYRAAETGTMSLLYQVGALGVAAAVKGVEGLWGWDMGLWGGAVEELYGGLCGGGPWVTALSRPAGAPSGRDGVRKGLGGRGGGPLSLPKPSGSSWNSRSAPRGVFWRNQEGSGFPRVRAGVEQSAPVTAGRSLRAGLPVFAASSRGSDLAAPRGSRGDTPRAASPPPTASPPAPGVPSHPGAPSPRPPSPRPLPGPGGRPGPPAPSPPDYPRLLLQLVFLTPSLSLSLLALRIC